MPLHSSDTEHSKDSSLPRSLYVPEKDPRANLREIVDSIFSDKFMMALSLILVPMIVVPLFVELNTSVLDFLEICDWIIVLIFVVEYVLKLFLAADRWRHFKSPWHLVDLLIVVLPFAQYMPMVSLSITGSPSLLLRLLRLPRAVAVGGRAVAGRRQGNSIASENPVKGPETVIHQVDSELSVTTLTWEELKTHITDAHHEEWLDIHYISDEGFERLSKILGIAEPHFKSALVDEIYPHIDYVQKSSFIFLQSGQIQYPESAGSYLTISRSGIIVVCNGTKIITVSRHSVDLLDQVICAVQQSQPKDAFVVPVLYKILEHRLDDYKSILGEIELEVLKIGNTPRSKLPKDFLERIYQLDKEVSRLVSNLVHFKDMLSVITSKKVPLEGFDSGSEEAFQVLQEGASYLNELSHDMIDNLRSIIDLYINETSFETNRILKILAVITSISVIPSAISGVIGTNLLDVPYGAYLWQVSFLIGVAMVFVVYTFYKLGWLKT
ncbi:MAG: ion transporter [Candidatus Bathyarchaeota archaeon]|nr:ion transporter [Candidatus Bathyarchaeota archaeon]